MPAAVGVATAGGATKNGARDSASDQTKERNKKIKKLVKKYDTSKDGKIDVKEFGNLLAECNGGTRPTDEEIAWVHRVADCRDGAMDEALDQEDVEAAICTWQAYVENRAQIDEAFSKYDNDNNGTMEFADLKMMLTDLNGGVAPDDDEVQFVLKSADEKDGVITGSVSRMELIYAVAIWYARADARATAEAEANDAKASSACCIIA